MALDSIASPLSWLSNIVSGPSQTDASQETKLPDDTSTQSGLSIAQAGKGPGGAKLGTGYYDPEQSSQILQELEKEKAIRANIMSPQEEASYKAAAYGQTYPGGQGLTDLSNLYQRKQEAAKNAFDMQMQIENFKASQRAQELQRQALLGEVSGGDFNIGANATGANQQGTANNVASSGSPYDPSVARHVKFLLAQGDYAGANKFLNDLNINKQKTVDEANLGPTSKEIVSFELNGQLKSMTRKQADALAERDPDVAETLRQLDAKNNVPAPAVANNTTVNNPVANNAALNQPLPGASDSFNKSVNNVLGREGGYKATDGNTNAPVNFGINQKWNPDVDVSKLDAPTAKQILKERYWDKIDGDHLDPKVAEIAFDAAVNQGPDYAKKLIQDTGGDTEKMLSKRMQDYVELAKKDPSQTKNLPGWLSRVQDVRNKANGVNAPTPATSDAPPVQETNQGTVKTATPVSSNPATKISIGNTESAKANIEVNKEVQKKLGVDAATRENNMINLANNFDNIHKSALAIQNIATRNPKVLGLGQRGDWDSIIINATPANPFVRRLGKEGMEELIAQNKFGQNDINDRNAVKSNAANLQVAFAKEAFQGSRMEQAFLRLANEAKGVGPNLPAETNKLNAFLIDTAGEMAVKQKEALNEYRKVHGHDARYEDFENSPEFNQIRKETQNKLVKAFPQYFTPLSDFDQYKKK